MIYGNYCIYWHVINNNKVKLEGIIWLFLCKRSDPVLDPDLDWQALDSDLRIRIHIKEISWIRIRNRINLQMTSQNVGKKYEPIIALFARVGPLSGSQNPDPDPHQGGKSYPDQIKIRIRIPHQIKKRIRVFIIIIITGIGLLPSHLRDGTTIRRAEQINLKTVNFKQKIIQ
jgi:hypothetical protein